ncbi:Protein yibA [Escherichia coli P12b]|nr:Protein yibA [Escherichia coli P12b]
MALNDKSACVRATAIESTARERSSKVHFLH